MDTITTQSVTVTITGISLGDAQQAEVFAAAAAGLSQVLPGTKSKQCMHTLYFVYREWQNSLKILCLWKP